MNTAANLHVSYIDVAQHWSPTSESYAGGDQLVTRIYEGWEMQPVAYLEHKWYAGQRGIKVYHVTLVRDNEGIEMPVIDNPYVLRLFDQMDIKIVPIEEREVEEETNSAR
jgi:hypothetical protein